MLVANPRLQEGILLEKPQKTLKEMLVAKKGMKAGKPKALKGCVG